MTANGNGARTTANQRMVRTHVLRFPPTLVGTRHVWKPNIHAAVIALTTAKLTLDQKRLVTLGKKRPS